MVPKSRKVPSLVAGGLGAAGDVGERRARLRLGKGHRAVEPALDHRADVRVDLLVGPVGEQEVGVADGQHRVRPGADVGGLEPRETGGLDDVRQLQPADPRVHAPTEQPGFGHGVERDLDLGGHPDATVDELGFGRVAQLVVRREPLGGDLRAEVEDGVEGLPGVLGVPLALDERLDVEPVVEQEVARRVGRAGRRMRPSVLLPSALGGPPCRGRRAGRTLPPRGGRRWRTRRPRRRARRRRRHGRHPAPRS